MQLYLKSLFVYLILQIIKSSQYIINYFFYIFYNKKFSSSKTNNKIFKKPEIIFESNSLIDTQLSHYVVQNAFKKMSFGDFKFYNMSINNFYNPKKNFFYQTQGINKINQNFNLNEIIDIFKIYKKLVKIRSKKKLINLKIKNIEIGELIYDSYLRFSKQPTIKFDDIKYKIELFNSISTFIFWNKYFKENLVDSIIQSHANYRIGIPGRIALSKKIKVFNVNIDDVYRLDENKKNIGLQFLNYKNSYKNFNTAKIKKFTHLKMKKRFEGGKGFDIPHTFLHGFKNKRNKNSLIKFNKNNNILISCHDFTDSPNAYGKFIFNDFYEWINYLGKFSKKFAEYNWYIKPHPNPVNEEKKIINEILNRFPHFKLIPANTPHTEILKHISVALTCRGTIGYEYPYFNIPVIMSSHLNKVVNYNFAYTAKNIKYYNEYLLKIPKIIKNYKAKKSELEEFYFTHYYLHDASNWIIKNYEKYYNIKFKKSRIGSSRISSSIILKTFKRFDANKKLLNEKSKIFESFYRSKKYKLIYNNFYKS